MPSDSSNSAPLSVWLVFLAVCSRSICSADTHRTLCKPSQEYWSREKASCAPCTQCAPDFTLSPCVIHKDAVCGPFSKLDLDWSFLPTKRKSDQQDPANVLLPLPQQLSRESQATKDEAILDASLELARDFHVDSTQIPFFEQDSKDSRARRTSGEADIPWDWQTGALVLAICACIVFFLVAGCSALAYVRQWRRMKKNFEPAGLEEISARLNLMVKAELAELTAGAPMNPGDPETRCQYLEKLLDRKRETPMVAAGWSEANGNLYIEEGESQEMSKRSQIARIHRNIESILSHKADGE